MALLLSCAAATLFMTGVGWFVQVVHHPLLGSVGEGQFAAYMVRHVASPPLNSEREEERRLNVRTLAVASAASATAAAVTSQLWIAGTWIAAAVTPVMVALLSEILHRPAEKLARSLPAEKLSRARTSHRPEPSRPPRPATERPAAPGEAPVRIYRQPSSSPAPRRARIALGVVAATAALAFAIAVVTITAGELLAGGSIGDSARRTTFGGGAKTDRSTQPSETERDNEPEQPARTQPDSPSEDEPAPAEPPVTEPPTTSPEQTTPQAPSALPPETAPAQP